MLLSGLSECFVWGSLQLSAVGGGVWGSLFCRVVGVFWGGWVLLGVKVLDFFTIFFHFPPLSAICPADSR